jgi:myo-inositol-1(or 4)-monophosphatase
MHRTKEAPLNLSLVGTGFGYEPHRRAWQAQVLSQILEHIRDIRRIGSAAIDMCLVAEGAMDMYYERGLKPWDLAAASIIAQEAGTTVCGLRGQKASETMTVAGRGEALAGLITLLENANADAPGK